MCSAIGLLRFAATHLSTAFLIVHVSIGRHEERLKIDTVGGESPEPERYSHAQHLSDPDVDVGRLHDFLQPMGELNGLFHRGFRQHGDELVPGIADQHVTVSHLRLQDASHLFEEPIPGMVAETVVHALEVVEVHFDDGERLVVAFGLRKGLLEDNVEETRIGEGPSSDR